MFRALKNPYQIGQQLYWQLRSEMYDAYGFALFGLVLREYLDHCGPHREELFHQELHIQQLRKVVKALVDAKAKDKTKVLTQELSHLHFPKVGLRLPLTSDILVTGLNADHCRLVNGNSLVLSYKNCDPTASSVVVIFGDGVELHPDLLCQLQLMQIMQHLWAKEGVVVGMQLPTRSVLGPRVDMVEEQEKRALKWGGDQLVRTCAAYSCAFYFFGKHVEDTRLPTGGDAFLSHFSRSFAQRKTSLDIDFLLPAEIAVSIAGADGRQSQRFVEFAEQLVSLFMLLREHASELISLVSLAPERSTKVITGIRRKFELEHSAQVARDLIREKVEADLRSALRSTNFSR
jgi:phosphatidylinositol-4,5-bisphosphate 3-kinase